MSHPAACPVYAGGGPGLGRMQRVRGAENPQGQSWYTPDGRSWLSSFIVLAASLFALYLFTGVAFRYKTLGLRGWDTIPHLDFWRSIPARAKRGWVQATSSRFAGTDIYSRYGYGPGAAASSGGGDDGGSGLISAGAGSSLHVEVPRGGGSAAF